MPSTRPTSTRRRGAGCARPAAWRLAAVGAAAALLVPAVPALAAPAAAPAGPTAAAAAATASGTRAAAATTGLFGTQDPTYDGAFRQGLSLLALGVPSRTGPAPSVAWLAGQQCADGGFAAFRADTSKACPATDLVSFAGEDSNSTAAAALGLDAVGQRARAVRAAAWLAGAQNADGGFPYLRGGTSDANSTGLALAALRAVVPAGASTRAKVSRATAYLARLQLRCTAASAQRGALPYQAGASAAANDFATAQALVGWLGGLPVPRRTLSPAVTTPACIPGSPWPAPTAAAAGYLARKMAASGGHLPASTGPGADWNATAWAVLGLTASGTGRAAAGRAAYQLRANARAYARDAAGAYKPAALATLVLVAHATGVSPSRYGGLDLPALLRATARA